MTGDNFTIPAPPPPDAFVASHRKILDGIRLFPWTPDRMIAGQSMGMQWPYIGKEGMDQIARINTYPGILKDCAICLWLCTQNETEVEEADSAPKEAYRKARKWAGDLGITDQGSDAFREACSRFMDIMNEIDRSTTVPKRDGPPIDEEEDEGKD